jgi:hypothetical protein
VSFKIVKVVEEEEEKIFVELSMDYQLRKF